MHFQTLHASWTLHTSWTLHASRTLHTSWTMHTSCLSAPPMQGFLDQQTKAQLLRQAANLLVSHGITTRGSLQYILHARVPLIKFRDAKYGVWPTGSAPGAGAHAMRWAHKGCMDTEACACAWEGAHHLEPPLFVGLELPPERRLQRHLLVCPELLASAPYWLCVLPGGHMACAAWSGPTNRATCRACHRAPNTGAHPSAQSRRASPRNVVGRDV